MLAEKVGDVRQILQNSVCRQQSVSHRVVRLMPGRLRNMQLEHRVGVVVQADRSGLRIEQHDDHAQVRQRCRIDLIDAAAARALLATGKCLRCPQVQIAGAIVVAQPAELMAEPDSNLQRVEVAPVPAAQARRRPGRTRHE